MKVRFTGELWHHQGACWKGRVSGPTLDLQNHNLHLHNIWGTNGQVKIWGVLVCITPYRGRPPPAFKQSLSLEEFALQIAKLGYSEATTGEPLEGVDC